MYKKDLSLCIKKLLVVQQKILYQNLKKAILKLKISQLIKTEILI